MRIAREAPRGRGLSHKFPTCSGTVRFAVWISASCSAVPPPACLAAEAADPNPEVLVVATTPLPGIGLEADKIPANVQTLHAADLARTGVSDLTAAMAALLSSVTIADNLDDSFQPDILFRGFEASPVLGTPQGLAVYQNGVRINEAFGDTVNWDLVPDLAIQRVDLLGSNPVYGLNALGGAIGVTLKNGFDGPGGELEATGGSFGERSVSLEYGTSSAGVGFYLAGKALDESGWRMFSNDSLRQLYSVLSVRGAGTSIDVGYTHASSRLQGQGAAPVQELAVSRERVFTGPQANLNRLDFLTLNGSWQVADSWRLQGLAYGRWYVQNVANGNGTNDLACSGHANAAFLCEPDGLTPLTDAAGRRLRDITQGGEFAIGANDYENIHSQGRGVGLESTATRPLLGRDNQFTLGAALDEARVRFYSDTELGVIDPDLQVLPSGRFVDSPETSAGGTKFGATPVELRAHTRYFGAYATDTLSVTPALAITVSARYNIARIDLQDELGSNLSGQNRYTHLNPALGATYRMLPALLAYGGVSENTRTPTPSEIECSSAVHPCLLPSSLAGDPPTLKQVIAHTAELGVRGKTSDSTSAPGGALAWNLGIFRTYLHDDIYPVATSVSSGFFENIGATRRQGIEAGISFQSPTWSVYANYSDIEASFESALLLPAPFNPFHDAHGDSEVRAGNRLPGIPRQRLKLGATAQIGPRWSLGATLTLIGEQYYYGDSSNRTSPLPAYHVLELHTAYQVGRQIRIFATVSNLFDARYATYGILSDPTGVGAPGIPAGSFTNGPGVNNRFQSPAAPRTFLGGVEVSF